MTDPILPDWPDVVRYLQARVASLQTQLEGDLDAESTARVRGAIGEVRGLLALPQQLAIDREMERQLEEDDLLL